MLLAPFTDPLSPKHQHLMSEKERSNSSTSLDAIDAIESVHHSALGSPTKRRSFWRSPIFAALILGLCNFCAPGRKYPSIIHRRSQLQLQLQPELEFADR